MSNLSYIREEKSANIGNFLVGRLLPFREKRNVGPFVFIDHMGPADMKPNENLDIGPHPHIGLSTLTYLVEGTILHHDSLESKIEINPGAVNWMTAGKGIVHSERTPEPLRTKNKKLHGLQIWVALPKHLEDCEPNFTHIEAEMLPQWRENGAQFKLIAGEFNGKKAPVPVHSPLYMLELKTSDSKAVVEIGARLYGECALYIMEGEICTDGSTFKKEQLLIAKDVRLCEFEIMPESTVYLFGGDAFPEERFIDWNFVSSDKEKIKIAKENWKNQKFPKIKNEFDIVPYPEIQLK